MLYRDALTSGCTVHLMLCFGCRCRCSQLRLRHIVVAIVSQVKHASLLPLLVAVTSAPCSFLYRLPSLLFTGRELRLRRARRRTYRTFASCGLGCSAAVLVFVWLLCSRGVVYLGNSVLLKLCAQVIGLVSLVCRYCNRRLCRRFLLWRVAFFGERTCLGERETHIRCYCAHLLRPGNPTR